METFRKIPSIVKGTVDNNLSDPSVRSPWKPFVVIGRHGYRG